MAATEKQRYWGVRIMPTRKIYPWAEWFDGEEQTIVRGTDFTCAVQSMQKGVLARARSFGGTCTTAVNGDAITFRFFKASK